MQHPRIFMKYSYEYKKQCVELYRQGKWPKTPDRLNQKRFRDKIHEWARIEEAQGPEALRHKAQNKVWSADEKHELVSKVLAGSSVTETAVSAGIDGTSQGYAKESLQTLSLRSRTNYALRPRLAVPA